MNFLAHAHLSFNHPEILVGNMVSDFVKGKKQFDYPINIFKGIKLHRAIDNFTDSHQATKKINQFFKPQYRLYSGVFTDVVYDYFLANDKTEFLVDDDLIIFTKKTYQILNNHFLFLPDSFKTILPHMITHNWLYHYKTIEGIQKSFSGLVRRAKYLTESEIAFKIFNEHIVEIENWYSLFYPDLKKFALTQIQLLLNE